MLIKRGYNRINEDASDDFEIENGVLKRYNGRGGNVVIPNSVIKIGNSAFFNCNDLTSINIPDSVKEICDYAFHDCSDLTSINIPNSVTKIGDNAFDGCYSLTSINIPDSVTKIGSCAFWCCSGLTSINIPKKVTKISNSTFEGCSELTSINIPDSVTEIGRNAFNACTSLTSINISDGVTEIGEGAFRHCNGLTSVHIPDSVTKIGDEAFFECFGLTSINIPNSVTSIGINVVTGCTECNVIVPNNIIYSSHLAINAVKSVNDVPIEDLHFIVINKQLSLIVTEDKFVLTEINGNKCAIKYVVQDYSIYTGYLFVVYPDRTYEAFDINLKSLTNGVRLIKVYGLYNDYSIGVREDGKKTFISYKYRGRWFDDCDVDLDDNLYIDGEKVN